MAKLLATFSQVFLGRQQISNHRLQFKEERVMELRTRPLPDILRSEGEFEEGNETVETHKENIAIVLLVRSYKEAPMSFATILTIASLFIMLGILVNGVVCYVMLRGKRYRKNTANFFILHLSVTELVLRLLILPIMVYSLVSNSEMENVHCKFLTFFTTIFGSAIFLSLAAIAVDRYQNIVHPMKALKSKRKPVRLVLQVWLYATIVSSPFVICVKSSYIKKIPEVQEMDCENCVDKNLCDVSQDTMGQVSTTSYFILGFLVPLVVILVLYTKIFTYLHERSNSGMMHKVAARSKSKAIRMLIITVFGYVLSLGPTAVFAMLRSYGIFSSTSFDVMLMVSWIVELVTYTGSLGNPLIYAYYNRDFRKELLRLLRKKN